MFPEADSRIFVNSKDATMDGSKSIITKANDTDVLAIAISVLPSCDRFKSMR